MSDVEDEAVYQALERAARELDARAGTVHERVACPRCRAPVGGRCRAMPRGWAQGDGWGTALSGRLLKHSHPERLHADGIYER